MDVVSSKWFEVGVEPIIGLKVLISNGCEDYPFWREAEDVLLWACVSFVVELNMCSPFDDCFACIR